jgi:hypothetical protein
MFNTKLLCTCRFGDTVRASLLSGIPDARRDLQKSSSTNLNAHTSQLSHVINSIDSLFTASTVREPDTTTGG